MEPLSNEERAAMKKNGRGVTDADINEYEQLLVQRHWNSAETGTFLRHTDEGVNQRLEQLYQKLYNKETGYTPPTPQTASDT